MVTAALLAIFGEWRWDNAPELWAAFGWTVCGLSLAGMALLISMARRNDPTRTAALMLLVPPGAAIQAWLLFGESLTGVQLAGFALALAGVALAQGLLARRGFSRLG